MRKLYIIGELNQAIPLNTGQKISMSWADGMIGVMPVFTNKRKAKKYAGDKEITEAFEMKKKKQ